MNQDRMTLIRIRREIEEDMEALERIRSEYQSIPEYVPKWIELRTRASLLHDFYNAIERIFSRIASELNGGVPNTEQWHRDLLRDMSLELPEIRPPVISRELYKAMDPFLRFRHLFRNLYGFEIEEEKMTDIENRFNEVHERAVDELNRFIDWLRAQAEL